jgi:hypothetical protein
LSLGRLPMPTMTSRPSPASYAYFVLAASCTATKASHDLPARHDSADAARDASGERGIYRGVYACEGRRCELDKWAVVGDDP